jgi:hypothetical protein
MAVSRHANFAGARMHADLYELCAEGVCDAPFQFEEYRR